MESQSISSAGEQAKKYLFDLTFDSPESRATSERDKPKPTFTEEQLEAAKKEAYAEGAAAGKKAALEDQQQHMNALLTQINKHLAVVIQQSLDEWQRQLAQMQQIALVIARKIMPRYVERNGLDEIEAIITKVVTEMSREPRLVFRVCEAQFDDAKARINAIAEQAAYAGKLVILGDPELGQSECRIEWADGGIERDLKTLWQDIDRVLEEVQALDPLTVSTEPATETPATDTLAPPPQQQAPDSGETP